MKYAVILGDGMADWKIPALGGKTCLESARTPVMDALAPKAELGRFRTVPEGFKPGSDVANMSVLGFDPAKYYTGRSPLEAVAMGISLNETDVTLRANLVTLSGGGSFEQLTMADYSAGEISTPVRERLSSRSSSSRPSAPEPQPRSHTRHRRRTVANRPRARLSPTRGKQSAVRRRV